MPEPMKRFFSRFSRGDRIVIMVFAISLAIIVLVPLFCDACHGVE